MYRVTKVLSRSIHHLKIIITQRDDLCCLVSVEERQGEMHHSFTPSEFNEFVNLIEAMKGDMYEQFNTNEPH